MSDLDTFLRILDRTSVGQRISVDDLRPDLDAAQIAPSQYGPLFRAACHRGELHADGMTVPARPGSRRGGRVLVYVRTVPKGGRAA